MKQEILQSVETRRNALYDHYDLPDEAKKSAEAFFARLETFGNECADQAEFEKKLLASPLNEEYSTLFAQFGSYVKKPDNVPTMEEHAQTVATDAAKSVVEMQARQTIRTGIFRMLPESLQRWWVRGVYNIPVIGDILSAKNNADQAKRILGSKK